MIIHYVAAIRKRKSNKFSPCFNFYQKPFRKGIYKSCKIFSDKRYIYFKYENYTILNKYCGKSPIFTIHHGKQIDLIPIENSFSEVSKKFFIFVRCTDSNIKIFKKGNFIKTIKWNCIVTSIISSELKDYFVIGDEKGFLSLLNFNEVNENILLINRQKAHFSFVLNAFFSLGLSASQVKILISLADSISYSFVMMEPRNVEDYLSK